MKSNPSRIAGIPKPAFIGFIATVICVAVAVWMIKGRPLPLVRTSGPTPAMRVGPGMLGSQMGNPTEQVGIHSFPPRSDLSTGTTPTPGSADAPVSVTGTLGTPPIGPQVLGEPPTFKGKLGIAPKNAKAVLGTPVPPGTPGPGSPSR